MQTKNKYKVNNKHLTIYHKKIIITFKQKEI